MNTTKLTVAAEHRVSFPSANLRVGANRDNEKPNGAPALLSWFFRFLTGERRQASLHEVTEKPW